MGLVQVKPGLAASLTTLTITLDNPTGTGHGLVVMIAAVAGTTNPTVSGVTLGGVADNFAQVATGGTTSAAAFESCWLDLNCASGQTSVVITATGGAGTNPGIIAWVYEFDNLLSASAFDKTSANASTISWTSNATATLSQASEIAVGIALIFGSAGAPTVTGPASPWVNQAQQTTGANGVISGYDILNSTSAIAYAGTAAGGTPNDGTVLIVTLKAPASASGPAVGQGGRPQRVVTLVSNSGWRGAGHSR